MIVNTMIYNKSLRETEHYICDLFWERKKTYAIYLFDKKKIKRMASSTTSCLYFKSLSLLEFVYGVLLCRLQKSIIQGKLS